MSETIDDRLLAAEEIIREQEITILRLLALLQDASATMQMITLKLRMLGDDYVEGEYVREDYNEHAPSTAQQF